MIRALLAGAFATSALADECTVDLGVDACRDFGPNGNFLIQNKAGGGVEFSFDYHVNKAIQYVGDSPWPRGNADANTAGSSFTDRGCTLQDTSAAGDTTTVVTLETAVGASKWTCPQGGAAGAATCDGTTGFATRSYTVHQSMQNLVAGLDVNGRFTLYFQRVYENPITGNNINLKWIAQEACKVAVDVSFECTGGNCVEVTTIVCASFAGIAVNNDGEVSIECKVPSSFAISSTNPSTTTNTGALVAEYADDAAVDTSTVGGVATGSVLAADVWTGPPGNIGNTFACNAAGGANTCTGLFTTGNAIPEGGNFRGLLRVTAWVNAGSIWTNTAQELHRAYYNLTRASQLTKKFNMPVNVLFYSEADTGAVKTTSADILTKAGNAFNDASTARPFLAKSEITYDTSVGISQHTHAYIQIVSKVITDETPRYSTVALTSVNHVRAAGTGESLDEAAASGACTATGSTTYSGTDHYPLTHLYCANFMNSAAAAVGTTNGNKLTNDVVPGDNLVLSLKWKLVNPGVSAGTGKAQLLQDGATEAQSVEVSLTIQLGGGETTITTAGGSDGSSDPTVTYIIIAVCIVAAGLILAVVVVAFMCLRNRSQEQLVSMSPQKCTVAAVYDISQPKKADAMDV